jgi:HK97 family phage major capsid protein
MKITREQQIRLNALLSQDSKSFNKAEKSELATLQALATKSAWNPETDALYDEDEDGQGMTADEVQNTVVKALETLGLDAKSVTDIKAALQGNKSLTADDINTAITKHLGGTALDQKTLMDEMRKALAESTKGSLTSDQLDAKFAEFAKSQKSASKFEYGNDLSGQFPCEHRTGNLSVAQKQLLNTCLMHVSEEAIVSGKSIRPKSQNDGITAEQLNRATRNGEHMAKSIRQAAIYGQKAITAGGSGSGLELVDIDLSSDLLSRLYLESAVAKEFVSQEIQMPTNPFKLPMTTVRPTFLVGSETGAAVESNPTTTAPVLTAAKLIGMSIYSYEAEEDAIVAILPMLQEQLGSAAADALEGALINGDTTATHQDSDIHAVTNHASKLFKGFRKYAIAGNITTSLASGGISAANIGAVRKKMGKYGIRPRDLVMILGPKGYNDAMLLTETLTAEKVGSDLARILTGEAPTLFGIRILTSAQVRENLNASGVYDGCTTTKGSVIIVHKPSFLMGIRRGFTVEVFRDITTQVNKVVASFRRAFVPKETPSATESCVSLGYNYTA